MVQINDSTRRVLLFLGVALCLFLVVLGTLQLFKDNKITNTAEKEVVKEIEKIKEGSGSEPAEDIVAEVPEKIIAEVSPEFIQKGSMRIKLEEAYTEKGEEGDIYFIVKGEDMILDEAQSKQSGNFFFRSPSSWNGDLLFHANALTPLLVCDYSNEGRFFNITFCINADALTQGYFGQKTRFVLTDQSFADLDEMPPLKMSQAKRTFVFDVVLPKEFYEQ